MARQHGKGGGITWATGYSSHVRKWTLNRGLEAADGTELGMANRIKDAGLKTVQGTFECYADDTTALHDVGESGALVLKINSTGRQWSFTSVLITNLAIDVGLDGNIVVTYSFELGGTLATGAAGDVTIA